MIYFVQPTGGGLVKIGTSIRLSARLKQLAAEHGDLSVPAVCDGDRPEEQGLHERFAHLRRVGEWFEPGDDLLGFIVAEARDWDGTDDAPAKAKQAGTAIRVSEEVAELMRRSAAFEGLSIHDWSGRYLYPIVEKIYRDTLIKEAQRIKADPSRDK